MQVHIVVALPAGDNDDDDDDDDDKEVDGEDYWWNSGIFGWWFLFRELLVE